MPAIFEEYFSRKFGRVEAMTPNAGARPFGVPCTWILTLAHAAAALAVSLGPSAVAAQARKAASAEDLRPAYATSADVAEGKRVADGLCARCHGAAGISATSGVPHVAGQRPAYLYTKVKAYQSGARDDHAMESAVKFLNDDALVKVAAYYASLEPAAPPASGAAAKAEIPLDPIAAGKAAAAACAGCHGEAGVSAMPGTPSLIGFDEKYFVAAMNAYRSGNRKHDLMKTIAVSTSDADVKHVALFYALQKPAAAQTPSKGDAAAGKKAAAACAGCHGEQGVSTNPANPSLAGQDAEYLATATRAYKSGARTDETMKLAAAGLDDTAIADLAAYYAAQQPRQPKVIKPLTLTEWVQRCDRCHGISGNSTDPRTPAIAAQRIEYLQKALKAYQGNQRKNSVMAAMSASLTDADVAALSAFYARQKARPFVFVLVPEK
jgi:cytochrome c553